MSYKILLADDSVTVQKIITLTFSDEGVDVLTVNNGDEAISRLQYLRPALVMADVSIPGKNGYEICEFVKSNPHLKHIPVILLVPAFEPFDEEKARSIGADHFLTKPFQSIRTLISTVKNLIEPGTRVVGMTGRLDGGLANGESKQESASILELTGPETDSPSFDLDDELSLESEDLLLSEEDARTISSPKQSEAALIESAQFVIGENSSVGTISRKIFAPQSGFDDDSDHVLELDDVLVDVWSEPVTRRGTPEVGESRARVMTVDEGQSVTARSDDSSQNLSFTLPQQIVDEIVERVVAQVIERLPESLGQELAHRIAPQIIEILKQQPTTQKATYHDPDSLLELDEI